MLEQCHFQTILLDQLSHGSASELTVGEMMEAGGWGMLDSLCLPSCLTAHSCLIAQVPHTYPLTYCRRVCCGTYVYHSILHIEYGFNNWTGDGIMISNLKLKLQCFLFLCGTWYSLVLSHSGNFVLF